MTFRGTGLLGAGADVDGVWRFRRRRFRAYTGMLRICAVCVATCLPTVKITFMHGVSEIIVYGSAKKGQAGSWHVFSFTSAPQPQPLFVFEHCIG